VLIVAIIFWFVAYIYSIRVYYISWKILAEKYYSLHRQVTHVKN